jgi:hypothetical protein
MNVNVTCHDIICRCVRHDLFIYNDENRCEFRFRIYDYQENGRTFETVDEFLRMLDDDFLSSTRVSFRKYLSTKGFQKRFIDEIGQLAALVNYDQSVDTMHGFPGMYSTNDELHCQSIECMSR